MNANIETALMSLIGNDPRFQRAELKAKLEERDRQLMAANILNGQTAQTADLIQRLRPAPVPAFIVPAPSTPTGTTPTT